jgi:hypothetical protein
MTVKNYKGQILREWNIEKEDDDRFVLKDPTTGEVYSYPKSTFEQEKKSSGASRDGSKIIKPDIK